jgi:putative tryptophan/tyrosine transport system substrate-binding protein
MRRRDFMTLVGGAVLAWPLTAWAQQGTAPVVGVLNVGAPEPSRMATFVKGLGEMGYAEGHNVAIEYRWADNERERLPELAADLVRRRVTVIAAMQTSTALAAKAATSSIPVVFYSAGDAVEVGLVPRFNRPGGNLTGINTLFGELGPKQLGLLHDLLPGATRFGLLVNPGGAEFVREASIKGVQAAADKLGRTLEILSAAGPGDIDAVFAGLPKKHVDGVLVSTNQLFFNRRVQLATVAVRHGIPTIFNDRAFAEAGGLMSYGNIVPEGNRQVGIYVGRILKGEKPSDMPVMQPTKFEFVINLQTARTIGIEIPPTLLAIADEVIE